MPEQTETQVIEAFRVDIDATLRRLRAGRLKLHIPPQIDLYRRRPRALFHHTPEFFIQTGGATDFECPGKSFRLDTGEACLIPRGVPHAEMPVDRKSSYGVLVCMHARDGFFLHRGKTDPKRRIQGYGTRRLITSRSPLRYLDDLAEHTAVAEAERPAFVYSLVEVFLLSVLAELEKPQSPQIILTSPLVTQAQNHVRTHLADSKLSVAGIARLLGCSPDHLSRQFHRETGLNPSVWINRERITLARDLLAEPRLNVAEIGWSCGFNEASYFIRVFRRHVGMTPRAYRLNLRRR